MRKTILVGVLVSLISFSSILSMDAQNRRPYYGNGSPYYDRSNSNSRSNDASYSNSSDWYKGYLEAGYSFGVGDYKANQLDITTTHGITFGNMFFVGAGTGVNILFTNNFDPNWSQSPRQSNNYGSYNTTAVMLPVFADFRLNFSSGDVTPFIDCKIGSTFLVSSGNVYINDGWLDNNTSLYFSPSIGVRIATGRNSAINLGATYNLISQKYYYWDYWDGPVSNNGISLNSFGVRFGIEW